MLCVPHHSAQGVNVFMNFCHGGDAELANALLDAHPEIDINQRTDDVSEGEGEQSTHTHHCKLPAFPSHSFLSSIMSRLFILWLIPSNVTTILHIDRMILIPHCESTLSTPNPRCSLHIHNGFCNLGPICFGRRHVKEKLKRRLIQASNDKYRRWIRMPWSLTSIHKCFCMRECVTYCVLLVSPYGIQGRTALVLAAHQGHLEVVKTLLDRKDMDVHIIDIQVSKEENARLGSV